MMTPLFRVVLVAVSVGTLGIVLSRIRKSKLNIEDSIFWILLVFMFVVFAVFPSVPDTLAGLLGIYSTANFLFLFMIFILIMRLFSMSMRLSSLEDKVKSLVQEIALRDSHKAEEERMNVTLESKAEPQVKTAASEEESAGQGE
ncbi:hypothetical protein UYO_1340 [Lachnospiraceae bacterium JC7]|nr:hypothetical protein UYO_1340 [Lachnospiraceae bacterium JC7]